MFMVGGYHPYEHILNNENSIPMKEDQKLYLNVKKTVSMIITKVAEGLN